VLSEHLLPVTMGSDTFVICGCGPNFNMLYMVAEEAKVYFQILPHKLMFPGNSFSDPSTGGNLEQLQVMEQHVCLM